jgi:hypothetical protein
MENVLLEAVHDILESDDLDKVLDECDKKPAGLFMTTVDNESPPSCDEIAQENAQPDMKFLN